ncbi:hypothetical protein GCM10022224_094720 [Nonomuraea antimicrobica]|uniref:Uncharacterized protein n=1 Tax=Nonomuraea antimicrobica TaxID=561173 RepID=A0ABP7E6P2_9ACTN
MVDRLQVEARIDLGFASWVGSPQNIDETPQAAQRRCQAVAVDETGRGNGEPREPVLQLSLSTLFLTHPTCDERRVGAGFQGRAAN